MIIVKCMACGNKIKGKTGECSRWLRTKYTHKEFTCDRCGARTPLSKEEVKRLVYG